MVLTPEQERRAVSARVARLSTADGTGRPHVIPVCFVYEEGNFYTAIDGKPKSAPGASLRRLRNISANPRAALLIDHYSEDWSELSYLLVSAAAHIVSDDGERARAVRALREKYHQYETLLADDATVIRLRPEGATSWSSSGRP